MKLIPRAVERPWGGRRLASLCGLTPDSPASGGSSGTDKTIGEAWIHEAEKDPRLILKWIDALENLSIQNHPREAGYSKREAWYFLERPFSGKVITGIDCAVDAPDLIDHVLYTDVEGGDVLELPAGRVHALTPGSLVFEVQEPLDVTYRIYDWGRGRDVHIQEARRSLSNEAVVLHRPISTPGRNVVIARKEFTLEIWMGQTELSDSRAGVLTFVSGPRLGQSHLLAGGDIFFMKSTEQALWATV